MTQAEIPHTVPALPTQGRRIAIVGKGGSGKSTTAAHVLAHWGNIGVPCIGLDTDKPGEDEDGSLYSWANLADLGAPVYPAPSQHQIASESARLTPEKGLCLLDSGAWERKTGGPHLAVLAAADIAVFALPPTRMELERAGSVLGALAQLEAVGARVPRLVILQTLVNPSAGSAGRTRLALERAGHRVLSTVVPRSDARDGLAQAFGRTPRLVKGSALEDLSYELLHLAAEEAV
ncbi:hypothetical protein ABT282_31025 [Streptomyces sp. NPDC000927]|uniref:hypothetical protein n=1 Tax=Streptomyces sp. NPDC000927 TaxID=3154371 RepID=UPI00332F547D